MGEEKFICVRYFEIIGEYTAAACARSGAFLEQVITTNNYAHANEAKPYLASLQGWHLQKVSLASIRAT